MTSVEIILTKVNNGMLFYSASGFEYDREHTSFVVYTKRHINIFSQVILSMGGRLQMRYEHDANNAYLEHYGIKGQTWGVRRFQNEDGTLT